MNKKNEQLKAENLENNTNSYSDDSKESFGSRLEKNNYSKDSQEDALNDNVSDKSNEENSKDVKSNTIKYSIIAFVVVSLISIAGIIIYWYQSEANLKRNQDEAKMDIKRQVYLEDEDISHYSNIIDECKDIDCVKITLKNSQKKEVERAASYFEKKIWDLTEIKIENRKHYIKELYDLETINEIKNKYNNYKNENDDLKAKIEKEKKEKAAREEEELQKIKKQQEQRLRELEEENKKLVEKLQDLNNIKNKDNSDMQSSIKAKLDEILKSNSNQPSQVNDALEKLLDLLKG